LSFTLECIWQCNFCKFIKFSLVHNITRTERLELSTCGLEVRCSIQLSYVRRELPDFFPITTFSSSRWCISLFLFRLTGTSYLHHVIDMLRILRGSFGHNRILYLLPLSVSFGSAIFFSGTTSPFPRFSLYWFMSSV
jgi:hypothetical protein